MTPIEGTVHPQFSLLGVPFSEEAIVDAAYSMIKEGEPYEKDIGDFIMDWVSDLPMVTVQTSGTSGKPNKVKVTKKALVNSVLATGEFFNLKPGDRCLLCLPAAYIAGKMMLVRALVLGLDLYIVPPGSTPLAKGNKYYDFCAMVPVQVKESLGQLSRIGTLIIGGAPLPKPLEKVLKKTNTAIYETFGMTETLSHIAVRPVNIPGKPVGQTDFFEALPGVKFESDHRDCLVIHVPHLRKSPVVTNDIVKLISETRFKWLGRADYAINSGGIKLFPETIEAKISDAVGKRFFLAGEPDDKLGERLVLYVEGKVDKKKLSATLKSHQGLKPFEVPRKIREIPSFVETESGKVHRSKTLNKI